MGQAVNLRLHQLERVLGAVGQIVLAGQHQLDAAADIGQRRAQLVGDE